MKYFLGRAQGQHLLVRSTENHLVLLLAYKNNITEWTRIDTATDQIFFNPLNFGLTGPDEVTKGEAALLLFESESECHYRTLTVGIHYLAEKIVVDGKVIKDRS